MRRSPGPSKFKGLSPWNRATHDVWKNRKTYTKEEMKERKKARYEANKAKNRLFI